ncbi:DUF2141 domain-containing protein [Fibrella sp. HMF5335]|uniref:DUF2141 domain-containing protein n=1 Tax=Fibrella rubiginis TaxID=2817060 RepID=A0A939K5L4_9BACT|nr:DUF2141 domain-containing protein [Fibrella rubiginis]MBO0936595.1 DUF2141 domain-containing protein [Fibrella rubiginis]
MLIFLAALLVLLHSPASPPRKATLTVEIRNIQEADGRIQLGLFKPSPNFPDKCKPFEARMIAATKGSVRLAFDVEPGEYALAAYHDVNSNGRLDTRLFGIPKEPYGFSNNVRPRMSAPTFADCRVVMGDANKAIYILLK